MRAGDIVGTLCSIEGMEASDIGIVDIRDSLSYVEILNHKGKHVMECLQTKPIKGKIRKVRKTRLKDKVNLQMNGEEDKGVKMNREKNI